MDGVDAEDVTALMAAVDDELLLAETEASALPKYCHEK